VVNCRKHVTPPNPIGTTHKGVAPGPLPVRGVGCSHQTPHPSPAVENAGHGRTSCVTLNSECMFRLPHVQGFAPQNRNSAR
jgi:hypothetical protein